MSAVEEDDSEGLKKSQTGRRTQLPAPQPDTSGLSLWNILKKNIGKDLSKIAMPVALNEPLSMLQVGSVFSFKPFRDHSGQKWPALKWPKQPQTVARFDLLPFTYTGQSNGHVRILYFPM